MGGEFGLNVDRDGCARCLRAGYYKMGVGNFLHHPKDGFAATCVVEYDIEDDGDEGCRKSGSKAGPRPEVGGPGEERD